ncbi:DUF3987 domain-containing protein [uncultured Psychrobacter sp.]|uniref:DUF3987 domain-containing protein n=1 Tax=uncultured Psychrobacter sp. TaxID=259303 RepID=UPI0025972AF7|nr:DUF3987 domain-containing protein [uncultured Psychrobacter sp.]
MTTTLQTATYEKAHADNMGSFIGYIADIENATPEQRAQDDSISQLDGLQDELNLPTNHIDNTRYLHDDISMRGGNSKGERLPNTKGRYGLVMVNNKAEPVNIAARTPNNDDKPPIISDTTQAGAYAIGPMSRNSDWWLVTGLKDAVTLYAALAILDSKVTVLACLNQSMFDMTLRHFSEVKTIHIIDTAQHKDALTSRLAGVNAVAHITIDTIISRLHEGDLISNLIADADTIDLSVLAWPTPEPLSSDPSKPTRYPIEAWDGLLQRVIKKIAYYQQVPDAMAGQCILGALAHMGQAHVDAPIGYKHMPASLILITEGESGSGKTQAMDLSHYKIKEYEQKQYEEYITRYDEHKAQLASLKGADLKDYQANEPIPHNPERLFKDATIEPVLDKFVNGEITDASWSTDDAAQFFNGHTMKGDTAGNALAAITDLYSGGEVNRTRSQKNAYANPRTKAYNVRMTLMLMAQRIILEPALTDDMMNQQGFLARALIACPNSLQGYRTWDDIERRQQSPHVDNDLLAYWDRCSDLLDPVDSNAPTDEKGAPKRYKMRWQDKQTEQVFYEHMQAIEDQQAKNMPLEYLKAYASRMAENASRIATLIAFFDKRKTITTDDIKRAFMLVSYSTAERLRYQDATPTGEQSDIEKLSVWLIDKAKGKNPAVLNKSFVTQHAPNALRGKKLNFLLDDLESMGHIRLESEGRRRLVYVNPKLIS